MSLTVTTERQNATTTTTIATLPLTPLPKHLEDQPATVVLRQDPFAVTLDESSLLALATVALIATCTLSRLTLSFLILLVPTALLAHHNYQNFLNLGYGGTPRTPTGYARLSFYGLFALHDPFTLPFTPLASPLNRLSQPTKLKGTTPPTPPETPEDTLQHPLHTGILSSLPYRPGPRPHVVGLAPHRQLNQHGSPHSHRSLLDSLASLAARRPSEFVTGISSVEKYGPALFALHPVNLVGKDGEICHVHMSDKSMHLNLHPDDIREVLAKGWGQRHPLAWGDAYRSWWGGIKSPVPETFVMIYAPRDDTDLKSILRILEAAIWFTSGEKVDLSPSTVESGLLGVKNL